MRGELFAGVGEKRKKKWPQSASPLIRLNGEAPDSQGEKRETAARRSKKVRAKKAVRKVVFWGGSLTKKKDREKKQETIQGTFTRIKNRGHLTRFEG